MNIAIQLSESNLSDINLLLDYVLNSEKTSYEEHIFNEVDATEENAQAYIENKENLHIYIYALRIKQFLDRAQSSAK